jgi:hypothetical protein
MIVLKSMAIEKIASNARHSPRYNLVFIPPPISFPVLFYL